MVGSQPTTPLHNELERAESKARCKSEAPRRLSVTMRNQHRPKQELCDEVAALRKQVADLKAEMVARRRVEDALRQSDQQLRALSDSAPAGLCLVRPGGTVRAANLPFARLLGYESPAELRAANLELLRSWRLGDAELDLPGNHPHLGRVTLRHLLASWVVHDLGHLAQVSRVMAKQYREAVGPWRVYLPVLDR